MNKESFIWLLIHNSSIEGVTSYGFVGAYSCICKAFLAKKNHRDMLENYDNEYEIRKIKLDGDAWLKS